MTYILCQAAYLHIKFLLAWLKKNEKGDYIIVPDK